MTSHPDISTSSGFSSTPCSDCIQLKEETEQKFANIYAYLSHLESQVANLQKQLNPYNPDMISVKSFHQFSQKSDENEAAPLFPGSSRKRTANEMMTSSDEVKEEMDTVIKDETTVTQDTEEAARKMLEELTATLTNGFETTTPSSQQTSDDITSLFLQAMASTATATPKNPKRARKTAKTSKITQEEEEQQKRIIERLTAQFGNNSDSKMLPEVSSSTSPPSTSSSSSSMTSTSQSQPLNPLGINSADPKCENCGTNRTCTWRRDDLKRMVCNPCGLYRKNHFKDRPVTMRRDTVQRRQRRSKEPEIIPNMPVGDVLKSLQTVNEMGIDDADFMASLLSLANA